MDIEFHYWMTGIIAKEAGFSDEESYIVAYSSQYVDENDVCLSIKDKSSDKVYGNFISQTMDILKPKDKLMRIYPIFHFVPGDPQAKTARRRDGKMHLLNTTPDNELANDLLNDAFKATEDMRTHRIGIASHAYVDTWAHQNFVGWYDNFNAIGENLLPNIGHADAKHHPDWPGHRWDDSRLVDGAISNNHRFLSAAERLFEHYCDYMVGQGRYAKEAKPSWPGLEAKLKTAMSPTTSGASNPGKAARVARYKEMISLPEFKEDTWFDDAVETEIRGLRDPEGGIAARFTIFKDVHYWREDKTIEETKWFKFQEAVKAQERFALGKLSSVFDQLGVDIHKS